MLGIVVGATPGLNGPFAMALSLPVLISIFGLSDEALLPILGFLIGLMKGGTVGGAVPAILFDLSGWMIAYFIITALLLIYVPLSKISHYIYWFFSRYLFGMRYGRRGLV